MTPLPSAGPLVSLAGVITEALDLYCATSYSIYFSAVYLDAIDFVSISIALYGLIVFYALVKERLAGKQPLLKFLSIKGIGELSLGERRDRIR